MKKLFHVFFALMVFQLVLTGCSQNSDDAYNIVPSYSSGPKDEGTSENTDDPYKDKAVVIETVVDIFREPDLSSERVTQAIFNQPVSILEEKDTWIKVKVVDGYTGWLRSKFIDKNTLSIMEESFNDKAVVTGKTKKILSRPGGGVTLKEVVMGTELYIKSSKDSFYEVVLPGNISGWIDRKDTIRLSVKSPIPKTSAQDFIATVNKFMEVPYLWGGVSSWEGLDCSGLTYICSRINGVQLPRDADQQYEFIKSGPAAREDLKPGDLIFFSTDEDLKDVSHVGVYIGGEEFLHASSSKGSVTISSINEDYYKRRLKGIKRIFD
ncbi:MAG: NlpC/P60 family protein [Bacillota bacterium]